MDHLQILAIEKFAAKLKVDFPILLKPKDYMERIINIQHEHLHRVIDLGIERARLEFDKEALKEAKYFGK